MKNRAYCTQCTFSSCVLWNDVYMLIVMLECLGLVTNLNPAIVPVRKASALLRLNPKFFTVMYAEDYKTVISNCSSVTYNTAAWLPYGKYKVINYMGVKRGLSQ